MGLLLLLLRLLRFWEDYVLGLVTFHLQKASYWNLPTLVMYKYKIPLACIKRLSVSTCLDSSKKSTVEQNNTSETQEGCISCYQDLLLPSSLPRCLNPSKFQSKPRSLKARSEGQHVLNLSSESIAKSRHMGIEHSARISHYLLTE